MNFDAEIAQLERMKVLLTEIVELKKKIAEYDKPAPIYVPYPVYPQTNPYQPNIVYRTDTGTAVRPDCCITLTTSNGLRM